MRTPLYLEPGKGGREDTAAWSLCEDILDFDCCYLKITQKTQSKHNESCVAKLPLTSRRPGLSQPSATPPFPSPFPNCGWTFSGSILLVSGCNEHLQLLPKGMQHPSNAPASLSSTSTTVVSNQAGHSSTQGAPSWQTQHSTAPILEPQIQQIYKISTEANLHNLEDPQMFAQMQVVKRF